jgi:hypothetical protein
MARLTAQVAGLQAREHLVRVRDGFQKLVIEQFQRANIINIPVEFHDNLGDNRCTTISAAGYLDVVPSRPE